MEEQLLWPLKIMPDVLIVWMGDDGRMANRILSILLDPGKQRGDIHALNLLSLKYIGHVVEGERINAFSAKGLAWF